MDKAAIVCEWLRLALEDLRYARIGLQHGAEPRYIAFHAQQAAEKALKSLLAALGIRPPKTHSIEELITRIEAKGVNTRYLYTIGADMLTDYSVEARYPGPPVIEEEAEEAVTIAEKTLAWVLQKLEDLGIKCQVKQENQ